MRSVFLFIILIFNLYVVFSQEFKNIKFENISINVPENLIRLTRRDIELKYLGQGNIPDFAYESKKGDINVSFKKTYIPISEQQFNILKNNLRFQFSNSKMKIVKNDIVSINNKKYVYSKVLLKNENLLMSNLITAKEGKMVMIIVTNSIFRKNYEEENNQIVNSISW